MSEFQKIMEHLKYRIPFGVGYIIRQGPNYKCPYCGNNLPHSMGRSWIPRALKHLEKCSDNPNNIETSIEEHYSLKIKNIENEILQKLEKNL